MRGRAWECACVGGSKTNLALLVAQPWDYPVTFDLSKAPAATLTQAGNFWCNASGPFAPPLKNAPKTDPFPSFHLRRNGCEDTEKTSATAAIVDRGYDLLRRLGRVDLQRHYPELGVTDVCAGTNS